MNDQLIIQFGASKNKSAVLVDQNITISLQSNNNNILSYNESSVVDVGSLFDKERQASEIFRIFGRIDFISIVNGLRKNYKEITDIFTPARLGEELSGTTKNLPYSFDMYLCYPSSGHTFISGDTYIRNYVIASKLMNSEIFKSGFGRNIYFNYNYCFNFNSDFNVKGYLDSFNKPITELYLFFVYKVRTNGDGDQEIFYRLDWNGTLTPITYNPVGYPIGTVLTGDKVTYELLNFTEELVDRITYKIDFPYDNGTKVMRFKYNPFIPIKIRDFGDEVITANISGGTENDLNILWYAISIDNNGNYIWRDILPMGYIDPITLKGIDPPFINKRHYIFNAITLPLVPDTTHSNTANVFSNIKFGPNSKINTKPNSSLNTLGNRCA